MPNPCVIPFAFKVATIRSALFITTRACHRGREDATANCKFCRQHRRELARLPIRCRKTNGFVVATTFPIALTSRRLRGLPVAASLGALGVVYGDIGTSPLYALREAVKATGAEGPALAHAVLGVVSLILWSLIVVISLKYAILILRADNRGEGGILAMLAILRARHARP